MIELFINIYFTATERAAIGNMIQNASILYESFPKQQLVIT